MSGNIKVHSIKKCCDFHGFSVAKHFKTFQSIIMHCCFSFAFLTNYLNQSDFIVSQQYSEQFALLMFWPMIMIFDTSGVDSML